MSSKTRRTVIVLAALVTLSLPLVAQARPERNQDRQDRHGARTEGFLTRLWEHLTAPFSVFLDGTTGPTLSAPPPTDPGDTTDGRSILDPIG
ncbi:MAG TPA: hypothetical protein VH988_33805 [Thermoanaerobaculia bacterium]|jgi:hypothetical protein|nr:hypothetical protein [Thermoanaerobaculia bacterium]